MEIEDQGPRLQPADIDDLERSWGIVFPSSYRDLLLSSNGGRPVPDTVDIQDFPEVCTDVTVFFRIGGANESSDLRWNKEQVEESGLGSILIPIARDSFGSLFGFAAAKDRLDEVIFCNIDWRNRQVGVYKVAPSFEKFLAMLRPFES